MVLDIFFQKLIRPESIFFLKHFDSARIDYDPNRKKDTPILNLRKKSIFDFSFFDSARIDYDPNRKCFDSARIENFD